ncbi:MAG: hypothetical protein GY810_25160 [Aureispira sp.]|nr:hypothetical protein [Aureispira sp.]
MDTIEANKLCIDLPKDKEKAFEQLQKAAKLYLKHGLSKQYYNTRIEAFSYSTFDEVDSIIIQAEGLISEVFQKHSTEYNLQTKGLLDVALSIFAAISLLGIWARLRSNNRNKEVV